MTLPRELDRERQLGLVREYARTHFVGAGMVADVALHEARASDGERNPHAHILLTVRGVSEKGWDQYAAGGKGQPWNSKQRVYEWREGWAMLCNRYLNDAGSSARVDHRSLKARELDRLPQPKLGPAAAGMENRGQPSLRGREWRRAKLTNDGRVYASVLRQQASRHSGGLQGFLSEQAGRFRQWRERAGAWLEQQAQRARQVTQPEQRPSYGR